MPDRNTTLKLFRAADITPQELAAIGGGQVAYVKPMLSDEVARIYPGAPELAPGMRLFALLAADGSPILLTDSIDAAIAGAWEQELSTVSLH